MYSTLPLLDPETVPFRGRAGSSDKRSLKKGVFNNVQNFRFDSGALKVRDGSHSLFTAAFNSAGETPGANYRFLGGSCYKWGANNVAVMAVYDPVVLKVRLYMRIHNASSWSGDWYEATAASGKWGDTRMTLPDAGYCQFQGVPGQSGFRGVIVQSGKEEPRYIDFNDFGTNVARIIRDVSSPAASEAHAPVAGVRDGLNIKSGTWTTTNSGAGATDFKISVQGSAPLQYIQLEEVTAASGVAYGKTATMTVALGSAVDFSSSTQLILMAWCAIDPDIWYKLKIEAAYGATPTWQTIYDPSNGFDQPVYEDMLLEDASVKFRQIGIPLLDRSNLSTLRGLRFTVIQALPANIVAKIIGVLASGEVQGGAQYAISHYSTLTRCESAAKVLRINASEVSTVEGVPEQKSVDAMRKDEGPAANGQRQLPGVLQIWGSVKVPPALVVSPSFYYQYSVPTFSPLSTQGGYGVDTCVVYRKDPGEEEFTYVTEITSAEYSGGWTYKAPFTAWSQRYYLSDNSDREAKDRGRRAPAADCISMPQGYSMCYSNGRVYCSVTRGAGSNSSFNSVYASERDFPFRFRALPHNISERNSEASGYIVSLGPSDECLKLIAARITGETSSVFAFCRESVYRLNGLNPEPLAKIGTLCPDSCVEDKGVLFWVSTDLHLMRWGGKLENLSNGIENGIFSAIQAGERKYICADAFADHVYLSHGDASETRNYKVLVFDTRIDAFVSDDLYPAAAGPSGFFKFEGGAGISGWNAMVKRCFFTPTGAGMGFENIGSTTDAGTAIAIALQTREFAESGLIFTRRARVEADGQSNTLASIRVTDLPAGTVTGELPLTGSGRVDKFDSASGSDAPIGSKSKAVSLKLTGNMTGGTKIYAIWMEAEGTGYGTGEKS